MPRRGTARRKAGCHPWLLLAAALLLLLRMDTASAGSADVLSRDTAARASWEEAVYKAAEVAVKAVQQQSGVDLALRDVPLETLQVFNGRQHTIGLSVDGVDYQVVLGSERELSQRLDAQHALPQAQQDGALVASGLVKQHWQSQVPSASATRPAAEQVPSLPDVSLSGPLELHVHGEGPLKLFTPHAVDMGGLVVRSVKLAAAVTVKLSGLRSLQLRRPLELPSLPMGYLAEVYAHAKLGQPGSDFEASPGVQYLANALRGLALNTSLPLLAFDVTAADPQLGLALESVSDMQLHVGAPPPKLKVKRDKHGHIELQLRQGEVVPVSGSGDPTLDVVTRATQLARPWVWPLPHVDLSSLVPYEALLRSILASHPFDLLKVKNHGVSMRVTRSEITGTRLMSFEMEVRSRATPAGASQQGVPEEFAEAYAQLGVNPNEEQLMIFDVLVAVRDKGQGSSGGGGGGGGSGSSGGNEELTYVPLSVKLREVHGSTLSMGRLDAQAMLAGAPQANATDASAVPGYDHHDFGYANRDA